MEITKGILEIDMDVLLNHYHSNISRTNYKLSGGELIITFDINYFLDEFIKSELTYIGHKGAKYKIDYMCENGLLLVEYESKI